MRRSQHDVQRYTSILINIIRTAVWQATCLKHPLSAFCLCLGVYSLGSFHIIPSFSKLQQKMNEIEFRYNYQCIHPFS